ncbi:MAG: hypothetical protein KJI69_05310 [Patescibacteria group bacterium]|nr:hypothetical protein [Patescibacteria group bacterium]
MSKTDKVFSVPKPWSFWTGRKVTSLAIVNAMRQMVADGISLKKIGTYFGVSAPTAKYWTDDEYRESEIRRTSDYNLRNVSADVANQRTKKWYHLKKSQMPQIEEHFAKGLPVEA